MDELLRNHINIMDRYDPRNRVGLIVDEWGNWHNVEPGTNPGFLYQQNTLRDAMVAAVNLDLFNNYSRRVKMANIAQTVNVLQAMILTKDNEIVKTPSYYVFKMYKVHHDATLLPTDVKSEFYSYDDDRIPAISTSASKSEDGTIHITISNIDPNEALDLTCELRGLENVSFERGEIITGEKVNSYNDFGEAEEVSTASFSDVKVNGNQLEVNLPAKSIVMLELR
jgi:alpha-N-arabinofuranosidase